MKIEDVYKVIGRMLENVGATREETVEKIKIRVEMFKLKAQLEQNELLKQIASELHTINETRKDD